LLLASTTPAYPFTTAVEWQWLHRSVLAPVGGDAGTPGPSTAIADAVVTTFANWIDPSMCVGRPAIDVLFAFDAWQPPQLLPNCGPNSELRWSVWFDTVGVARWHVPQSDGGVEPQLYGLSTGTFVGPFPSLWHALAPHDPNVGYPGVYVKLTAPPNVKLPLMWFALGAVPGAPHAGPFA
jgi:hypothetical protein